MNQFGIKAQSRFDYIFNANPTATSNPPIVNVTWLNALTGICFICINNSIDANIWVESSSGGVVPNRNLHHYIWPIIDSSNGVSNATVNPAYAKIANITGSSAMRSLLTVMGAAGYAAGSSTDCGYAIFGLSFTNTNTAQTLITSKAIVGDNSTTFLLMVKNNDYDYDLYIKTTGEYYSGVLKFEGQASTFTPYSAVAWSDIAPSGTVYTI